MKLAPKHVWTSVLVVLLICVPIGILVSQGPGGFGPPGFGPPGFGPPGFGPPGFGPPGFGPPGFGPPGGGPRGMFSGTFVSLLEMPEVRKELDINGDQQPKVDRWLDSTRDRVFQIMGELDFPSLFEMQEEARNAALAEQRKKMDAMHEKAEEELVDVLDGTQIDRLKQLRIQNLGASALNRTEVQKSLQIDEEQAKKIAELLPSGFPGPGGPPGFGPPGFGPPGFGPPGGSPNAGPGGPDGQSVSANQRAALDLLTNVQKDQWESMMGKKFNFPVQQGFGGPGGPGGGPRRELLAKYDEDKNGILNLDERKKAREFLKTQPQRGGFGGPGRGPGGPGGRGGPPGMFGRAEEPEAKPGPRVEPADVKTYNDEPLYSDKVVRTLFFQFEEEDWEQAMSDFHNTDVDVPADLVVDGKSYKNVGVRFRGLSSYGMVRAGHKRSLNVSLDLSDADQRLYGRKTLNLLNSHEDPTFLHSVLYLEAARKYIPAPQANFVHVVINGESWGLYVNAEQFDKDFIKDNYQATGGTRWKVPGSPMGRGGLSFLGDRPEDYRNVYEIKSNDNDKSWNALIHLCKTLTETPASELPAKIEPILDVDGALKFLALDVALVNSDGYWIRSSDYNIYLDKSGVFHVIPHDANETLQPPMGPGMGGPGGPGGPGGFGRGGQGRGGQGPGGRGPGEGGQGPGGPPRERGGDGNQQANRNGRDQGNNQGGRPNQPGGSQQVDPLVGLEDPNKPLRSKLLAVPEYRKRYLEYVKQINDEVLDWNKLKPRVEHYTQLIDKYVEQDTRKLVTYEAFKNATSLESASARSANNSEPPPRGRPTVSLRDFVEQRHAFLNSYPAVKQLESK